MKKLLLSILLLLSFSGYAFGEGLCGNWGQSGTNPWTVTSADGGTASSPTYPSAEYTDVNACVNTVSAAGDTVNVPAATASWASRLNITKAVTLTGAGTANTIITANGLSGQQLIQYAPAVPANDPVVDISGFTFDGNATAGIFVVQNRGHATAPVFNWRFHGNYVQNTGWHTIRIYGSAFGLIDNNTFDNASAQGRGYVFYLLGDDASAWTAEAGNIPAYGTNRFTFIENNTIKNGSYIVMDSGEGIKWVARFNTIASYYQKVFDLHEDVGNAGGIAAEVYNNEWTPQTAPNFARFAQMGASQVIYNNTNNYLNTAGGITLGFAGQSNCSRYVANTYVWNNLHLLGTYAGKPVSVGESDAPGCFAEDTDYWDDYGTQWSYAFETPLSASPEGHGNFWYDVAALRPATCTTNDSYWETDNLDLYRCTSTDTWTKVYEPYTCPHPLAGTGSCDFSTAGRDGYSLGAGPTYYTLTVSKAGDGSGVVTSVPAGINCSTDCTEQYVDGTEVVLTSTVSGNNQFDGWSGSECSGTGTCTVTMSAARAVTATYTDTTPTNFLVTITYAGSGTGATTPAIAESPKAYASGATPTITQVAGSNSTFTGWSGTCSSCTGTGDCTPTITADCSVIATWASDGQYSITIAYPYNGETVESDVVSLTCGGDERICTRTFDPGDIVLTTTCATGWYGATWSGDDSGADPITITLGAADIDLVVSCTNGYGVTLGSGGLATLGTGGTATVYR